MQLSLNKLPWYAQVGAFVGLSAAAVGVFYNFYVSPFETEMATRQQQLTSLRSDINRGLATIYYTPELGVSRDSLWARANTAMERAERADPTSADVIALRAASVSGLDTEDEVRTLSRAVAIDPRNASLRHYLAIKLRHLNYDSAAVAEFRKVVDIEPDRAISLVNLGQTHMVARRYAEARKWFDSALVFRPELPFYYKDYAMVLLQLGDTAGARASAMLVASHGSDIGREEILAIIEARRGDSASARARLVPVAKVIEKLDCVISYECSEFAFSLAQVGEPDQAIAVLGRMKPLNTWFAYWTQRAEFDPIRNDPRFRRMRDAALSGQSQR